MAITTTVATGASSAGTQHSAATQQRTLRGNAADGRSTTTLPRRVGAVAAGVILALTEVLLTAPASFADPVNAPSPPQPPSDSSVIRVLPVVTPTPSSWAPKYPFPYDQTRDRVTATDITAMGEMCQWYSQQYATLRDQIDRLQFNRIGLDGKDFDYGRDGVQEQVDIVVGNIDRSLDFLTPRVNALTQDRNNFGDSFFPVYEGEQFFKLHEQLFNVSNGIKAHQPDWFTGPSVQKAKRHGSDIYRSHVCD